MSHNLTAYEILDHFRSWAQKIYEDRHDISCEELIAECRRIGRILGSTTIAELMEAVAEAPK